MRGVDVSDNNAGIDWLRLAASTDFAMVKATENDDYRSKALAQQDGSARLYGLEVGYYHYAQPNKAHWALQAQHFARAIDVLADSGNPIAIDLEEGTGDLTDWVLSLATAIEALCGRIPMLYSSPAFIAAHLRPVPELARLPLWLASWGGRFPNAPAPWRAVTIWQYADDAVPLGTVLALDSDSFEGSDRQAFRDIGVEMGNVDLAAIKVFLSETAVTLDGYSAELAAGQLTDERRATVARQLEERAAEAREKAG